MTEINLLPWRQLKREQEKKQFTAALAIMLVVAVAMVLILHTYVDRLIEFQSVRNQRLRNEILVFDRQINEMKKRKELREAFISRMMIVQSLQATRPLTVHLFDELIRVMPDGVFVNTIERSKDNIRLIGRAVSHTHISQMMRNMETNPWIRRPNLTEIKKSSHASREDNEFRLSFLLQPQLTFLLSP
ncbi:MAG: PilN domain-containing protein [Legionellaceae bacterium]|nr:PilN domain-containing protein [Legionellaceae bacterium]